MSTKARIDLPYPIADHETLWLDLFADGELDATQKAQLFEYLDATNRWKDCAVHLAHEKTLAGELKAVASSRLTFPVRDIAVDNPIALTTQDSSRHSNRSMMTSVLAACVAFVLGALSIWLTQDVPSTNEANSIALDPVSQSATHVANSVEPRRGQLASYRPSDSSLTFFEIEDTPVRATYYLQKPLPELFLEALVFAGHSVEVGQESMAVVGSDGNQQLLPINILQIHKAINVQY